MAFSHVVGTRIFTGSNSRQDNLHYNIVDSYRAYYNVQFSRGLKIKIVTRISALIALLLLVWYLVADRTTPYTSNVRLKAIVVDVVPQVSGYVSALAITNGELVKAGDLLARIDQRPFVLEVEQARSALQSATQDVGASSAQVQIAQANVTQARISLENTQVQSTRYFELEKKKVISTAEADTMRTKLAAAQSQLVGANADLERARQQLGDEGADNAQADVIVYTGDNWLMNNLGKVWIRLMSWLSYAY